jgi:hypothetical protein
VIVRAAKANRADQVRSLWLRFHYPKRRMVRFRS